ncbi:hypothetical protein E6P09_07025 [Haloferax mediterranei ATCC 33500]|uniref:Uncharacterized protein n=1 Tax=Haloferax mediterranei (strain ATCC 33500 / DSM 1411 / JCM 8866 / NBRC 14739 / NCIMB 2177 / R-4) TaxID=523841 RepID=I3R2R1_HALMT|nr:hypothetical protein [Haloferax mediterranei]AFK18521.1 hypothetical protein HFX_0798 [Haloferax mediterranei ATCC 33500]AHZ22098.1 hypothetical protein BM92_05245 [Haloferax mediterranei ATCC 33500]EMA02205.1 hypothetical protein C439_06480 [Haloferax mediterranei ATCC 33500]MDX5988610.1 hypothetical protein [Haloferax mediterranei ATCC 33500]QCQ75026.1 hypothetical protein E6P09_07025 [Haloferax mediterranei ATCC 33500]
MTDTKRVLWERWVDRFVDAADPTQLFATNSDGTVETIEYGRDDRLILRRSERMERMLREAGGRVVADHERRNGRYEGLVYMMYTLDGDEVVPRYLGKCGKFGASGTDLNSNLRSIETNDGKLARWGYANDYHLGDLSAVIFREGSSQKYNHWVAELFDTTDPPTLREPVYFWVEPWEVGTEGPYPDTRPYLEELEYQLIGIAFELFPERLLNTEGVPTNPEAYAKMRGWTDREETRLSDF